MGKGFCQNPNSTTSQPQLGLTQKLGKPGLVSILGFDFILYKSYKSQQQQEPHQNLLKDLEMDVWQGVSYSEG